MAARQWGRVSRVQVEAAGVSKGAFAAWIKAGYLHRVCPGVYAVGHCAPSVEADLALAITIGQMAKHRPSSGALYAYNAGGLAPRPHMIWPRCQTSAPL